MHQPGIWHCASVEEYECYHMIFILQRPHKALKEQLQADCHCIKLAGWEGVGVLLHGVSSALKWSGVIILSQSGSLLQCFSLSSQYHRRQTVVIENEARGVLMAVCILRLYNEEMRRAPQRFESKSIMKRSKVLRWRRIDSFKHKER